MTHKRKQRTAKRDWLMILKFTSRQQRDQFARWLKLQAGGKEERPTRYQAVR